MRQHFAELWTSYPLYTIRTKYTLVNTKIDCSSARERVSAAWKAKPVLAKNSQPFFYALTTQGVSSEWIFGCVCCIPLLSELSRGATALSIRSFVVTIGSHPISIRPSSPQCCFSYRINVHNYFIHPVVLAVWFLYLVLDYIWRLSAVWALHSQRELNTHVCRWYSDHFYCRSAAALLVSFLIFIGSKVGLTHSNDIVLAPKRLSRPNPFRVLPGCPGCPTGLLGKVSAPWLSSLAYFLIFEELSRWWLRWCLLSKSLINFSFSTSCSSSVPLLFSFFYSDACSTMMSTQLWRSQLEGSRFSLRGSPFLRYSASDVTLSIPLTWILTRNWLVNGVPR